MHRPWRKNILAKITEWSNCCEVKWCFGSVLGLDSKHNDYKAKKGSAGDIFSIKVPFDTSTPQIWVYPHIRGGNKHFALLIAVLSNLFHRWSKTSKLCHRSVFLRENVHPFSSFSSGRAVSSPITARTHIYCTQKQTIAHPRFESNAFQGTENESFVLFWAAGAKCHPPVNLKPEN